MNVDIILFIITGNAMHFSFDCFKKISDITVLGSPAAQSTPVGYAEAKSFNESPLRAVISRRTPSGWQFMFDCILFSWAFECSISSLPLLAFVALTYCASFTDILPKFEQTDLPVLTCR